MQYIWQYRLWLQQDMVTVDGRRVQVIDPGRLNTDAGPDFFNAKIKIDGQLWAGDVEIHVRASDWHRHHHDNDKAYDSVILHVVEKDDCGIVRSDGSVIAQLRMPCSPTFHESYRQLVGNAVCGNELPCIDEIKAMDKLHLSGWIDTLAYERLYRKSDRILSLLNRFAGDWEQTCYVTFARALGFGTNSEPFERLAMSIPLRFMGKHSDSQLSIEALLFGQSGLLDDVAGSTDAYIEMLVKEYRFLAGKFDLQPIKSPGWKMSRMRPANFPHRRIAYLASMVFGGFRLMSRIIDVTSMEDACRLFDIEISGYWSTHFTPGNGMESKSQTSALSRGSIYSLIINVVVPLLHAYGVSTGNEDYETRAFDLLHGMKAESNSIVAMFQHAGVACNDAFTSQALIELRKEYCETRKCLYCRIGHRMLSKKAHNKQNGHN